MPHGFMLCSFICLLLMFAIFALVQIRAMEANNDKIVRVLKKIGVKDTYKDAKGFTPGDLRKKSEL